MSAIDQILRQRPAIDMTLATAREYGITNGASRLDVISAFLERLQQNKKLGTAFIKAKQAGIGIFLEVAFEIGSNNVTIDVNASDEEIIKFLVG